MTLHSSNPYDAGATPDMDGTGEFLAEKLSDLQALSMESKKAEHAEADNNTDFVLSFHTPLVAGAPGYWLALPNKLDPQKPPLIAVHGIMRGAKCQAESFAAEAARQGRAVIAPLFDTRDWKDYQKAAGRCRADLGMLAVLKDAALRGLGRIMKIDLVGYSGGAQFVHRFALLYPHMVRRVTVVAAGWYTFPQAHGFPYGIGFAEDNKLKAPICPPQTLAAFLQLDIRVFVGSADTDRDENLRKNPSIDKQQGDTRVARAQNWTIALNKAAHDRGLNRNPAELSIIQGASHSFRECIEASDLVETVLN